MALLVPNANVTTTQQPLMVPASWAFNPGTSGVGWWMSVWLYFFEAVPSSWRYFMGGLDNTGGMDWINLGFRDSGPFEAGDSDNGNLQPTPTFYKTDIVVGRWYHAAFGKSSDWHGTNKRHIILLDENGNVIRELSVNSNSGGSVENDSGCRWGWGGSGYSGEQIPAAYAHMKLIQGEGYHAPADEGWGAAIEEAFFDGFLYQSIDGEPQTGIHYRGDEWLVDTVGNNHGEVFDSYSGGAEVKLIPDLMPPVPKRRKFTYFIIDVPSSSGAQTLTGGSPASVGASPQTGTLTGGAASLTGGSPVSVGAAAQASTLDATSTLTGGSPASVGAAAQAGTLTPGAATASGTAASVSVSAPAGTVATGAAPQTLTGGSPVSVGAAAQAGSLTAGSVALAGQAAQVSISGQVGTLGPGAAGLIGTAASVGAAAQTGALAAGAATLTGGTPAQVSVSAPAGAVSSGGILTGGTPADVSPAATAGSLAPGAATASGAPIEVSIAAQAGALAAGAAVLTGGSPVSVGAAAQAGSIATGAPAQELTGGTPASASPAAQSGSLTPGAAALLGGPVADVSPAAQSGALGSGVILQGSAASIGATASTGALSVLATLSGSPVDVSPAAQGGALVGGAATLIGGAPAAVTVYGNTGAVSLLSGVITPTELDLILPAAALALINEYGKSATFEWETGATFNPATGTYSGGTPQSTTLKISPPILDWRFGGTDTKRRMSATLYAAADAFSTEPEIGWEATIDGLRCRITGVRPFPSGEEIALYALEVEGSGSWAASSEDATDLDEVFADVALDLIDEFGHTSRLAVISGGGYSPATGVVSGTEALYWFKMTPPAPYEKEMVDGEVIREGDVRCFVAEEELPFEPELGQKIEVEALGDRWGVVRMRAYQSGEKVAVWELQLRR